VWVVRLEERDRISAGRPVRRMTLVMTRRPPTTRPTVPPGAETRYRTRMARAGRLMDGGLWLVVPAVVVLVVGVCALLLGGTLRLDVIAGGLLALLAAGGLVLRGRSEAGRARRAAPVRWRVHAVRVHPPLETCRDRVRVDERGHAATG